MPRRNLYLLIVAVLVSAACYAKAQGRYARQVDALTTVFREVDRHFVREVDPQALSEGAIRGAVQSLEDDNSQYLGEREATESRESLDQEFDGIGVILNQSKDTKEFTILRPLLGTPAYERGLLAGDRVLAIDGEPTKGLTMDQARRRLRGKAGEIVRLSVLHPGATEPVEIAVPRAKINVPYVMGDTLAPTGKWSFFIPGADHVAYIRLSKFGEKSADELAATLDELTAQGIRGAVLDLRGNPGGLLEEGAVRICDMFVREGNVVSTRGRDGEVLREYNVSGKGRFTELPLVVLIDRDSASASEIVAACLQDHGRAKVVGERSYGKGSVQSLIRLDGGRTALKLTVAHYYPPSGHNIQKPRRPQPDDVWGVSPDEGCTVPLTDDQRSALFDWRQKRDRPPSADASQPAAKIELPDDPGFADLPLRRALEVLAGK